jgi:regulator of sigma E protease
VQPKADQEHGVWVGKVGVALTPPEWVTVRLGPIAGLQYGVQRSTEYAWLSVKMLWRMLIGQASTKNLSGSFTIADMAGRSASMGLLPFISFLAVISVSLGVMNLLPIPLPALDGGYLVHYAVEMLTGKTVNEATFPFLQKLGIAMIVLLMLVAHWNDAQRYFPQLGNAI